MDDITLEVTYPPSPPTAIELPSSPSLSDIEEKCVYIVVNVFTADYMYAVYRIEMSRINCFPRSDSSPPQPIYMLDEPLLLLGREFLIGMAFFSFGSRIYMLGASEGKVKYRSRSVHIFDTVTFVLGSAASDQQMLTEKYQPVVIQPSMPFNDRVYVFSGDKCCEDLEVFYPDRCLSTKSCWFSIGGPPCNFPPGCKAECHSIVSDGFVLLTTNNMVLLYNISWGTWILVEDKSYRTCFFLEPCVFAYEIAKWLYFCVPSHSVGEPDDIFMSSYFVDKEGITYEFGQSGHLYLPHGPPCKYKELDYLLYLGKLCFYVVRSGYDRPGDVWRFKPDDPVPNHHATVTLFCIDPTANVILEERSSHYKIIPLDSCVSDDAYICDCFII